MAAISAAGAIEHSCHSSKQLPPLLLSLFAVGLEMIAQLHHRGEAGKIEIGCARFLDGHLIPADYSAEQLHHLKETFGRTPHGRVAVRPVCSTPHLVRLDRRSPRGGTACILWLIERHAAIKVLCNAA